MSYVSTWQTSPVLRIPGQRPRPANELPTDVSRAAAKRTTGAGAVYDRAAHVAHFTAAVYTGLHAAEERLQSQLHTLEGGHGQTAVCASSYLIVLAHQRELTALAGEGDRPSRHAPCVAPFLDGAVVKPAMICKPAVVVAGELDAKLVRARSVILLHAASTYPRRLLLKSPGLHPWRRHHRR